MKRFLKKVLSISLCATLIGSTVNFFPVIAPDSNITVSAAETYGDFKYEVKDNDTISITDYIGNDSVVTVPQMINGRNVGSIDNGAFSGYSNIKSINIPESVTSIGKGAFYHCTGLTSINIPEGVVCIDESTFSGCIGLTRISIPEGVTSINNNAFLGCTGLINITIPQSVTQIGGNAFERCTGLTSITISEGVTSIGSWAFYFCTSLTSVNIPSSVTKINMSAFECCTGLKNITISDGVNNIGEAAFSGCTNLTSVYVNPDNLYYSSINDVLYNKNISELILCPAGKTSITIPESVTNIASCAFCGCTGLKSINIPDSVTIIHSWTFSSCTGLRSVTIPKSLTCIDDYSFYNCTSLTSITIPNGLKNIGNSAFYNCPKLTSIIIPESVTYIGNRALGYCDYDNNIKVMDEFIIYGNKGLVSEKYAKDNGIEFVEFAENITGFQYIVNSDNNLSIIGYSGSYALITIPSLIDGIDVTVIDKNSFSGCKIMTSINIPDSVTIIGNNAFSDCTGLTAVIIPGSVRSIGDNAFSGCTNMTSIIIPNSVMSIGSDIFSDYSKITIFGMRNSYAETYAEKNNIPFSELYTAVEMVSPTCTSAGKKGYFHCNYDNKNYPDTKMENEITDLDSWIIIPPSGHDYDEQVILPTCTEQGYTLHTCKKCGDSYKDIFTDAKGHNYTDVVLKPTCTERGYTIHICIDCKDNFIDTYTNATGHNYELTSQKAPTCTEEGEKIYKCTECGDTKTETIEATGHNYTEQIIDSTCTEEGYTVHICENCGDEYRDNITDAIPHQFGEWVITENTAVHKCIVCGTEEKKPLVSSVTIDKTSASVEKGKSITLKAVVEPDNAFDKIVSWKTSNSNIADVSDGIVTAKSAGLAVIIAVTSNGKIATCEITVKEPIVQMLNNTSVINSDTVQIGDKVRISASANGGTAPYTYACYYKRSTNTAWKTLGTEWGTNSSVSFTPTAEADYDVKVIVKDSNGTTSEKLFTVTAVKELELTNVSVLQRTNIKLGSAIPMIGKAVGGTAPYTYAFYFKRSTNTNWKPLGEKFGTLNTARLKPTATGEYDIRIDVKDKSGTVVKKYSTATVK